MVITLGLITIICLILIDTFEKLLVINFYSKLCVCERESRSRKWSRNPMVEIKVPSK